MVKILVTGGLGVIGSKLVKELRRRGHNVWISDIIHSSDQKSIRCDVGRYRQVERVFNEHDFEYVYHTAAEFGRQNGEDYYENLWMSNAVGTKNIIKLQEKIGFKMIFTSSSEVYGDYRGIMTEDLTSNIPIHQLNDYAISKWVNEMQIMNSASRFLTETVRVRLFNTYGPGEYYSEYRSAICHFIYKALHRLPYVIYANHTRTSSYIDDTIRTLANILNNFQSGEVYNIAGKELHDMKKVSDNILAILNMDDSLVDYREIEDMTTLEKKVDISKAIKDLGHKSSVNLKEGLPKTIEWQKQVYGYI